MIDTVQINYELQHTPESIPATYKRADYQASASKRFGDHKAWSCDDPETGYHAYGTPGQVKQHRVSLPRLLYGTNGMLIKNQEEIDGAMRRFLEKAHQLGTPSDRQHHFTRVDLVYQFRGDPRQFVLAHRIARHPRVRSTSTKYNDHSIAFEGSNLRIIMYDKLFELTKRKQPGNVVRVEFQLRGKLLKDLLGNGGQVTRLDFNTCYGVYRRLLLAFRPSNVPAIHGIADFLAIAERGKWAWGKITAFELYTRGLSKRQISRLRQQIAASRPMAEIVDWLQLLPAEYPPPPIEINDPDDPGFRVATPSLTRVPVGQDPSRRLIGGSWDDTNDRSIRRPYPH